MCFTDAVVASFSLTLATTDMNPFNDKYFWKHLGKTQLWIVCSHMELFSFQSTPILNFHFSASLIGQILNCMHQKVSLEANYKHLGEKLLAIITKYGFSIRIMRFVVSLLVMHHFLPFNSSQINIMSDVFCRTGTIHTNCANCAPAWSWIVLGSQM